MCISSTPIDVMTDTSFEPSSDNRHELAAMGAPVTPSSINSISQVIQRAIGKDRCSLRLHSSLETPKVLSYGHTVHYCTYIRTSFTACAPWGGVLSLLFQCGSVVLGVNDIVHSMARERAQLPDMMLDKSQWVHDADVTTCQEVKCDVSFSYWNRKHHCRMYVRSMLPPHRVANRFVISPEYRHTVIP